MKSFFLLSALVLPFLAWGCTNPQSPGDPTSKPAPGNSGATRASGAKAGLHFAYASSGLPTSGIWKCRPALADINGDGFLDLASVARLGKGPVVWLGDGGKSWKEAADGLKREVSCGGGTVFGDVNRDGHLDLVVADHCSGAHIYAGDGKGHWKEIVSKNNNFIPGELTADPAGLPNVGFEDVDLGDVNGDGILDMALAGCFEGGVRLFLGDGKGAFPTEFSTGLVREEWGNEIRIMDITGDGKADILCSHATGPRVWANDGKGTWQERSDGLARPGMKGIYLGIDAGDINGDGRMDLVTGNFANGVEVYLQNADGTWEQQPDVLPTLVGGATGTALVDFNEDKHLDLLVTGRKSRAAGTYYGIFLLLGDGKGHFVEQTKTVLPETGLEKTWCFAIGDVDRDGKTDFALAIGGSQPERPNMPTSDRKEHMQVWLTR